LKFCKPEVTGSIPVRSTPARSPLGFAEHDDFERFAFRSAVREPTPAQSRLRWNDGLQELTTIL
jgi:hypothetical protein